jgi:hypothetical protein
MKKTKHTEEKIIAAMNQMEAGRPTKEIAPNAIQLGADLRTRQRVVEDSNPKSGWSL